VAAWELARQGEAALAIAGPIRSNEDAWAVADAMTCQPSPTTSAGIEPMLARIVAIAGVA